MIAIFPPFIHLIRPRLGKKARQNSGNMATTPNITAEKSSAGVNHDAIQPTGLMASDSNAIEEKPNGLESHEVFKETTDGVNFRGVSWQRATVIFLKIQFAMSILSVPGSLATLGAVGGALSIVGWEVLNTC